MRTREFGTASTPRVPPPAAVALRKHVTPSQARAEPVLAAVVALHPGGTLVAPARVVIVEDHELVAAALAMALRQRGIEATTMAGPDPDAVIDVVRALAPVLVLLDLDLGPILGSGLELIQPAIMAGGRVVMLTGVLDRARLGACIEAGAAGVVGKTAGFTELVAAIQRAVQGEELLTEAERHDLLDDLSSHRQAELDRLSPFAALTGRERAVLARLVAGDSADSIASSWFVSLATVRSQIRSIFLKLGVTSQLAAVAVARQARWP